MIPLARFPRRLLLLALCGLLPVVARAAESTPRWWKGNLHTHSLWSDGDDYPEMITEWYKNHGYHFLALSDHNIIADHERWIPIATNKGGEPAFAKYLARFGPQWVEQRDQAGTPEVRLKTLREWRPQFDEPGRFLMIQSEEITGRSVHINATNIQELILPYSGSAPETSATVVAAMQKTVQAVNEQRKRTGVPMFPHINHPNFRWAITAEELLQVDGERFFEVYNGHPLVHNEGDDLHAGTERVWDVLLAQRLAILGGEPFFGLATDDSHNYHDDPKQQSRTGRGWVMVRAARLAVEDLIAAMEAGDFYASSGVTLKDVRREKDRLSLEIEAEPGVTYTTEFIGTRRGFDRKSTPVTDASNVVQRVTRRYSDDVGAVLATVTGPAASYVLRGDEIYVRARVVSSKLKTNPYREGEFEQAWTQPLITGAK